MAEVHQGSVGCVTAALERVVPLQAGMEVNVAQLHLVIPPREELGGLMADAPFTVALVVVLLYQEVVVEEVPAALVALVAVEVDAEILIPVAAEEVLF